MRFVYLAYPIDAVGPRAASDAMVWDAINAAKVGLTDAGVDIVYDPGDAFQVRPGAFIGREIKHLNTVALNKATGLLAFLPKSMPSVGVPQEIAQAERAGIPVAVVTDHRSWNLAGFDTQVFGLEDWEAAAAWLVNQQNDRSIQNLERGILRVKVLEGGQMPTKAHHDDAGWDLYASERVVIPIGSFRDVPCGVAVRFPLGTYGVITGRSSTLRKRGLLVNQGIIDTGYTGPLFAGAFNLGQKAVEVQPGERIAQMLLHSNFEWVEPFKVEDLGSTTRGEQGFGSSGL